MTPAQVKTLGFCVSRFAESNAGYAILGKNITSFTSGGCWILAAAVKRLVPAAELVALWGKALWNEFDQEQAPNLHHVLVKIGALYVDADGANTEHDLLRIWEKNEFIYDAEVKPLNPALATGISCDPRRVKLVYETLKAMCR